MRAAELARTALDRCRADQGLRNHAMNKPVLPISSLSLKLPNADRSTESYRLAASRSFPLRLEGTLNRVAFSAVHVVADPLADSDPWLAAAVDWDRTIAFREHIWDLGLGVAEAMDTAQRGMGLDWPTSLELIRRSVAASKARGDALVFSGAGTDHLSVEDAKTLDDVIRAYEEEIGPGAPYALARLAAGDEAGFHDVLGPTVPLSRHIFKAPTRFYKTGIVFMAYLNGHQDHFTMVGGQESARSALHLAELFRLADQAGLLANPELATRRMKTVLASRGVES